MEILSVFNPDDILKFVGHGTKNFFDRRGQTWEIEMNSKRYRTFAKSKICVCCGIEGTIMHLERELKKAGDAHFNLYSVLSNEEKVLMTVDHIIPKSRGGTNILNNLRTMCAECNNLRGHWMITLKQLKILRCMFLAEKQKEFRDKGIVSRNARRRIMGKMQEQAEVWEKKRQLKMNTLETS